MISGFRGGANEIRALLGCYAAQIGNSVPTFRDNLLTAEDGTDGLFRNVDTELPIYAA